MECRRHRFKEPQDLLHCLSRSLFDKKAIGLVERGVNEFMRALAQRFLWRLNQDRSLRMACQHGWRSHLIGYFMLIEDLVYVISVKEAIHRISSGAFARMASGPGSAATCWTSASLKRQVRADTRPVPEAFRSTG